MDSKHPENNQQEQNSEYDPHHQTPCPFDSAFGYRFKPTDEELITYYLKEKIKNNPIPLEIYDVDVYQYNPQTLSDIYRSFEDNEWYFFTPRVCKYPNGVRSNSTAVDTDCWKATGAEKIILNDCGETIGFRTTLIFYDGELSKGFRNNKSKWIMYEYRVNRQGDDMTLNDWVLSRIYLKTAMSNKRMIRD